MAALSDISNVCTGKKTKRMSDGTFKVYEYKRKPRKTLDILFDNEASKLSFQVKWDKIKTLTGFTTVTDVLISLLDYYLDAASSQSPSEWSQRKDIFADCDSVEKDDIFLCSKRQLYDLCSVINNTNVQMVNYQKKGQVAVLSICDKTSGERKWASSAPLAQDYELNYKGIHAYICSGMIPCQFDKFCTFLGLGMCTQYFREKAISVYARTVSDVGKTSMNEAIQGEQEKTPEGICIISDARHGCRKNSYHSDVMALGHLTHRVLAHAQVTKQDERSSQKHEVFGTKKLYECFQQKGVRVVRHGHDRNAGKLRA
jgi:hypothetical protein